MLVRRPCSLALLFGLAFILAALPAHSEDIWTTPTPDELKMTLVPQVPGAAAVYLDYDQTNDENVHQVIVYVRIKVLTQAGVKYGDVELPYDKSDHYSIKKIEARTIHSDGTIVPFSGKPFDKQVVKAHSLRYNVKVFTMPEVTVGSILEYRYVLHYDPDTFIAPRWYAQQDLFAVREHFVFQPDKQAIQLVGGASTGAFETTSLLPKGAGVQKVKGQYVLTMENVPPLSDETWMPPKTNLEYKVLFYYINPLKSNTVDDYWTETGKDWSTGTDEFMNEKKLQQVAAGLVQPGDSDAVKAAKLYDAVMMLENTRFTREETEKEAKVEHAVINSAVDVWNAKRGTPNDIAMLFIGLARAAGLKAYAMWVADRSQGFFDKDYLDFDQLDDILAIVVVDGKEQFFDPGARFCPPGKVAWWDTASVGLRQGPTGTTLADSPAAGYRDAETVRHAQLQLDAEGKLTGTIRVTMIGTPALEWRQRALETDAAEVKKEFEDEITKGLPGTVQLNLTGFEGLNDWKTNLVANLTVTGTLGTRSGKLLLLPVDFFQASAKPVLVQEKREYPVYIDYPRAEEDDVSLALPPGLMVEGLPKDASMKLQDPVDPTKVVGIYRALYKGSAAGFNLQRVLAIAIPLFPAAHYSEIVDFYGSVNAQDQEQVVLRPAK